MSTGPPRSTRTSSIWPAAGSSRRLDDVELTSSSGNLTSLPRWLIDDAHGAVARDGRTVDDGAREKAVAQRGHGDQHLAFVVVFDLCAGRSFHDPPCYPRSPPCQKEKRAAFRPLGYKAGMILRAAAALLPLFSPLPPSPPGRSIPTGRRRRSRGRGWSPTAKAPGSRSRCRRARSPIGAIPGEAGVPPSFDFSGSENLAKAEVEFPLRSASRSPTAASPSAIAPGW